MRAIRSRRSGWRWLSFAAVILFISLSCAPLCAQTSSMSDRLSPDTIFFMHWRGKPFITDAEKKNHVLQFLEDPDFAPLRQKLADDFRKNMEKQGNASAAPTLAEFISLLDNPMTVGSVANLLPLKNAAAGTTAPLVGFFFIYDATGKAGLIDKLRATPQMKGKESPAVITYDFNGTTVEARTSGTAVTYTAHLANYYIFADQKQVVEDLIARFHSVPPSASVTQLPVYKEIRSYIGSDSAVEFFAQMPELDKIIPADQKDKPFARAARNIHLEKLRVAGGGLSFAGEATRFHGAILGDTTPIGVFDVTGESTSAFVTQPVVGPGPFFSISRFSWAAVYELLRIGSAGSLNPQQAAMFSNVETMAQNFLGMSIGDALQLFTGEVASETTYSEDGNSTRIYAITIQKPKEVLRVLRAVGGSMIVAEDTSGETTFLDISVPSTDPATGRQKRAFYYIAVTPEMIYVAPRKAMVREAMARLSANSGRIAPRGISSNPDLNQMRSLLPENLSGLSAADMSHFPWGAVIARYEQTVAESAKDSKDSNQTANDYWKLVKPEVFSRHLHTAIYGWWKDSNGIYFDSFVQ